MQKVFGFPSDEACVSFLTHTLLEEKALRVAGLGAGVVFLPAEFSFPFTPVRCHYKLELSVAIALSVGESVLAQ